jgi:hypothetical protein
MADDEHGEILGIGGMHVPDYLRPTYANFVNVNHSPWDFRLTFGVLKVPVPGEEADAARDEGQLRPEAVADVIIPANLMHGFISALQDNFSGYLDSFGAPGLDPEGPRPPE